MGRGVSRYRALAGPRQASPTRPATFSCEGRPEARSVSGFQHAARAFSYRDESTKRDETRLEREETETETLNCDRCGTAIWKLFETCMKLLLFPLDSRLN